MDYLQLLILGLVQGITEFLPISSSAHLILLPELAGWEDQGLVYDIAAHLGSLMAVIVYFHADLSRVIKDWSGSLAGQPLTQNARVGWYIIIASLPVAVCGYFFYDLVSTVFRQPLIIACSSIFFGLVLLWADRIGKVSVDTDAICLKDAIWVGLAQILSLIPGTSRSGITITAGLLLGFNRETAARFSFYLAIPVILMAGSHEVFRYLQQESSVDPVAFILMMIVSGISAWLAIKFFITLINRTGMLPYVIYRVLLGLFLIYVYS
ncbi:MAG TPA: undecaprenyl-diphosphate phosphatase [Gammaproteobacteria bacterium]